MEKKLTSFLGSLIPRPIVVDTELIRGKLFIEGNPEYNYLRFRFCFNEPEETAPVTVSVMAGGKKYVYNCISRRNAEHEMKTEIFHPEFFIGRQFTVISVDPLVEFGEKAKKP